MNKHVTSMDLSKRLYEKGVRFDSEFLWSIMDHEISIVSSNTPNICDIEGNNCLAERYPALLSSEIGELLPEVIKIPDSSYMSGFKEYKLTIDKIYDKWNIQYIYFHYDERIESIKGLFKDWDLDLSKGKEVEVRGLMLEYLIDNGLITNVTLETSSQ